MNENKGNLHTILNSIRADEVKISQKSSVIEYYSLQNRPFNVPFLSKGIEFVGYSWALDMIWEILNEESQLYGHGVVIQGIGGIGKTQLAIEFAYRYNEKYPNGVIWFNANEDIDAQLIFLSENSNWVFPNLPLNEKIYLAKENIFKFSECLLIFDDVDDLEEIREFLSEELTKPHILITSRNKQPGFRSIPLKGLSLEESRELLLKVSRRNANNEIEKDHLGKILAILGNIPLAIELVGGYLAEHENVTFAKYHQFLNDVPLEILEREFPEGSFTNHDRSIIQTLRISEKTIRETPLMVEILKVLAWSGSSSMGTSLLKALIEVENDFEFESALGDAYHLRLLKKDEDAERYAIHPLIAKSIQYENSLIDNKEWHQKIINNLENWFIEKSHQFDNLTEFESEAEHLNTWQELTYKYLPSSSITLTLLREEIPANLGNYEESFDWVKNALYLYESEHIDDKNLLIEIYDKLGNNYAYLGNFQEALNYQLQVLKIRQKLFGKIHPYTTNSLSSVGSTYTYLGEYEEALKYQERALKNCETLFGDFHPYTANSLNRIGSIYLYLGKYQEALQYQEKALKLRKELFGEKHPDMAISYSNIGLTYRYLGNYQEALQYQERALELRKELFGEKHPDMAISYSNIGLTYGYLGKYQEALQYQERALEIHQEFLGKQHPNTIVNLRNLILTYLKLGYNEKAGKIASEFMSYIPQNSPDWKWLEEISRPFRPNKNRHKKRR